MHHIYPAQVATDHPQAENDETGGEKNGYDGGGIAWYSNIKQPFLQNKLHPKKEENERSDHSAIDH